MKHLSVAVERVILRDKTTHDLSTKSTGVSNQTRRSRP